MRVSTLLLLSLLCKTTQAQTHEWWANNVKWNGINHWSSYISSSARFLGPNALPIPETTNGVIDSTFSLGLAEQNHFTEGETTNNINLELIYPFLKNRLTFKLQFTPIEIFNTSHRLKTERKVFWKYYDENHALGDVYLSSNFQLCNEKNKFINSALRLAYRFPSSSLQGAARFTDAPGYYLDLSFGKTIVSLKNAQIYLGLMQGIFVWQTNNPRYFQNDAYLYGLEGKVRIKDFVLNTSLSGYTGYLKNGDTPQKISLGLTYLIQKSKIQLEYYYGKRDLIYTGLSLTYHCTLN